MTVYYEWIVEQLETNEPDSDIVDVNHFDTYANAVRYAAIWYRQDTPYKIGLTKNIGNENDGIVDRAWAYVNEEGKLSEFWGYGADEISTLKVPKKFHDEVAKA